MISVVAALVLGPQVVEAKITSVSVFKNGYSFLTREVNLSGSGEYVLSEVPSSKLGTFWILPGPGMKLKSATVASDVVESKYTIGTLNDLLNANVGKTVTLELAESVVRGVIVSAGSESVLLKTDSEIHAVGRSRIVGAKFPLDARLEGVGKSEVKQFRFSVEGSGKLTFISLQEGLAWAPMYWVDTSEKGRLDLVCRGSLVNKIGALEGVPARLASGNPFLPLVQWPDPLFTGSITELPDGLFSFDPTDNSIVVRGGPRRAGDDEFGGRPALGAITVDSAEDLFFYMVPSLTVGKDNQAYVPLFSQEETYKELLAWTPSANVPGISQTFWHTLVFKNTGSVPLSSGAATVYNDGQLVGQGVMSYAPVGSEAELVFSQDRGVEGEAQEEEISRQSGAVKQKGLAVWDRVRIKGTLLVRNLKDEAATIRIREAFEGELLSTSEKADVRKDAQRLQAMNPTTRVVWNVEVPAGQEKTITYEYSVLVSSQGDGELP